MKNNDLCFISFSWFVFYVDNTELQTAFHYNFDILLKYDTFLQKIWFPNEPSASENDTLFPDLLLIACKGFT